MQILTMVIKKLPKASFTLKLAKWDFVEAPVTFLGEQVGHGRVSPIEKCSAITGFPATTTNATSQHWLPHWISSQFFKVRFSLIQIDVEVEEPEIHNIVWKRTQLFSMIIYII